MQKIVGFLAIVLVLLAAVPGAFAIDGPPASAELQTAGKLLINLETANLRDGTLTSWINSGALGGAFKVENIAPRVHALGEMRVAFFSGDEALVSDFPAPKSITGGNDWSLEIWAFKHDLEQSESTLVSWAPRGLESGQTAQFSWGQNGLGAIHWGMDVPWKSTPETGKWQYLAVTHGAGTETLYVHGVKDNSTSCALKIAEGYPIVVGAASAGEEYVRSFQGAIGAVRIHEGVLSEEQIRTNFERDQHTFSVIAAVVPSVKVSTPAGIRATSAYLSGWLNSTGGAETRTQLYWGEGDVGRDAAAWEHFQDLGPSEIGSLMFKAADLNPDTTYYYRYRSANSAGANWSEEAGTLRTRPSVESLDPAERPFRIVVWPDSQNAIESWPYLVKEMAQWVVQNRDELNIEYVIHVGDMVQTGAKEEEWKRFDEAFSILDGKVPYILSVGNHDLDRIEGERSTVNFNNYFPVSRFRKMKGYGGSFPENSSNNSYHTFKAGGTDWLIVSLMYYPDDAELAWANRVVAEHPNHRVIVATHSYLTHGGRDTSGEYIWQNFVKRHPNILCVFCGHLSTVHFNDTGDNGNPVYEMLFDWQNSGAPDNNSYLAIVEFAPGQETISVESYSPVLDRFFTDPRGTFSYENVPISGARVAE